MSETVLSFEDGGTATLRDPRLVPVKVRRVWEHAQMALGVLAFDVQSRVVDKEEQNKEFAKEGARNPELVDAVRDASVLALVAEWSYGPVTQAVLDNLPGSTYDKLTATCEPLAQQMSPKFKAEIDPKADVLSGTLSTPESVDSDSAGKPLQTTPSTSETPTSP